MSSPRRMLRYARKMQDRRQVLHADIGAFDALAQKLLANNIKRVFLISGPQTNKLKLYDGFVEKLQAAGARCFVWPNVGQNSDRIAIEECTAQCRTYNCEAIVAFGGGKVIDVAKLVAARMTNPTMSLYQMRGAGRIPNPPLPLYVVSTTGSGAESSACSLILQDKQVYIFYSENLIPRTVVLDPELVLRLPMENMASAAILALTHAIEAYVSPLSDEFPADKANVPIAIPIFFSFLEKCYKHGVSNDMYLQLMMAPYYSGIASRRIGFGYAHSFALYLSEKYKMPPGRICAAMLPIILEHEFDEVKHGLADLARVAHLCSARASEEEAARAFIDGFRRLCRRVDMPEDIPEIKMDDAGAIIEMALYDASKWPHPKKLNAKTAYTLLRKLKNKER
ncbi:MAG: iron-containing alcohol dehydrogenase [Clostridiales bacterium]|nr:iron-containing alcohol dehydrogenase [Clostridiales bacterium]